MLLILLVQNRLYQNFHKRRRTREDRRKGYHSSKRTKKQAHHHQVTLFSLRERLYDFIIFL